MIYTKLNNMTTKQLYHEATNILSKLITIDNYAFNIKIDKNKQLIVFVYVYTSYNKFNRISFYIKDYIGISNLKYWVNDQLKDIKCFH